MHTLMVILLGLALLAACLGVGWLAQGVAGVRSAALVFMPVWLACAGVNLWVGVHRGYGLRQEIPIMLMVFAEPALIAAGVWWCLG